MPKIHRCRSLNETDFLAIRGTELHAKMIRNQIQIDFDYGERTFAHDKIYKWIEKFSIDKNSIFFIKANHNSTIFQIYLEEEFDDVYLKLIESEI